MKIAFWSPFHGQCGTTSNMVAISLITTLISEYNSALLQTSYQYNALEYSLIGKQAQVVGEFFNDTGIDALSRNIKSEPLTSEMIFNCSISLLNERLHLIPATNKINREHYESKLLPVIKGILSSVEACHDIVFIDVNAGKNDEVSKRILGEADLIVVNISQNNYVLDTIFQEELFPDKKIFYLVGNYDKDCSLNLTNIKRKYNKIKSDSIGAIPYNTGFKDSLIAARPYDFLQDAFVAKKDDKDHEFANILKDTTKKILKKINMNRGLKNDSYN